MHYLTYICHKKGYLGLFRGEEKAGRQKDSVVSLQRARKKQMMLFVIFGQIEISLLITIHLLDE